jgi:hypothetical protein
MGGWQDVVDAEPEFAALVREVMDAYEHSQFDLSEPLRVGRPDACHGLACPGCPAAVPGGCP